MNIEALESQLAEARETNRRLNRKLQELESQFIKSNMYALGRRSGFDEGRAIAKAQYDKQLAAYKHATRDLLKSTAAKEDE